MMRRSVRVITLITAIFLIVFGILRGEAEAVLTKAINICMECIGLG